MKLKKHFIVLRLLYTWAHDNFDLLISFLQHFIFLDVVFPFCFNLSLT